MKNFQWLKQIASTHSKLERRLSLGEYKRAVSWSKYLVSSGAEIKGGGEEEWSADMSQLYIGNKFASGRHSRIYRGVYKQRDAAIKLISQPEEDGDLAAFLEKQFSSEVALLFRLRHPNIISFIAACKKAPVFCIITEYYPGGSLRKYLHQQEPYSLPLNLVLRLALDIARGMQYLHAQGILHRDLKSENLLLDEDMCVKVADFGISCLESQCGSAKGFTGTYRWMAPEMIKEKHHTKKVDVYSFGIVLWELLTALTPFDDMTPEQAAFAVCQKDSDVISVMKSGKLRFSKPNKYWIESSHKRYVPSAGDNVLGIVVDARADNFLLDIKGPTLAFLPVLAFEGGTRRNIPKFEMGTLLYVRVVKANTGMNPELSCMDATGKAAEYGPLKDGFMFESSTGLSRTLLSSPTCPILETLGKKLAFEIAVGLNGRIWVNAASPSLIVLVANTIIKTESLSPVQQKIRVESLIQRLQ